MRQEQSHCLTRLLEASRLDQTPQTGKRLNLLVLKSLYYGREPFKYLNCCSSYSTFKLPLCKLTKLNAYTNQ